MGHCLLLLLISLYATGCYAFSLKKTATIQKSVLFAASVKKSGPNHVESDKFKNSFNRLKTTKIVPPPSSIDEQKLLQYADISKSESFYDRSYPQLQNLRAEGMKGTSSEKLIELEENYGSLMNVGYQRRYYLSKQSLSRENEVPLLERATSTTKSYFELGKSKQQQLDELKEKKLSERSGIMKITPIVLHKYIDYLSSLYVKPKKGTVVKNMIMGAFFSAVVSANAKSRMGIAYYIVGQLCVISLLLARGMPEKPAPIGGARRQLATWSSTAFKTALAVTAGFSGLSAIATLLITSCIPVKLVAFLKYKATMVVSLLTSAYFTSFYEVFEEKSKNGSRWAKAMENALPKDEQEKLRQQVYQKRTNVVQYDYNYDPEIDDYPAKPKYIDEGENLSGPHDEDKESEVFAKWLKERTEARKPPVEVAPDDAPWVGSKTGMYPKSIKTWIQNAYKKNVINRSKWSSQPQVYKKDYSEFNPTYSGPMGFRDKRIDWLGNLFKEPILEDKIGVSRAAARAFGTYRKSMHKIDEKVELRACDT